MDSTQVAERMPGGYNTRDKVSLRGKRKRDKAQVKLRDRMRRKIQGSTDIQNRLQNSISKTTRSVPPAMPTLGEPIGQPKKSLLFRDGYWRTQQERYDNIIHTNSFTHGSDRDEIPFQALMDRFAERRDMQSCDQPTKNNSLLTIRSYKRPTAPYAIQQQPMIKKMVGIEPLPRPKPERKGPYVLVLRTKKKKDSELQSSLESAKTKETSPLTEESMDESTTVKDSSQTNQPIDELTNETKAGTSLDYMKTWTPSLQNIPEPAAPPDFDDRGVTNYKLQLQQANKLAESRFQYKHSIDRASVYKYSTLPSIPTAMVNVEKSDSISQKGSEENGVKPQDFREVGGGGSETKDDSNTRRSIILKTRKSSATEILEVMEAKKKARRQKISENDFQTLLKTRNRYTSDTRVFKDEIHNMRRLSIISETNSVASDSQGRASSAERAGSRTSIASLKSVPSLEKIDEAKVVKDTVDERAIAPRMTSSPAKMYLIKEESEGVSIREADRLCAPPSSPVSSEDEAVETVRSRNDKEDTSKEDGQFEGMRWIAGDEEYVEVI